MFRKLLAPLMLAAVAAASVVSAQAPEKIDAAMNARIRTEGMEHSKIMWIEHYLTDVYGPRPIGSPNHKAAADWAVKTMTSFGMKNAHLEPFTWRGVGWLPGRATGFITSPVKANLKFEAVPWSPSTKGTVSGLVVSVAAPENPTEAEMSAYLASLVGKVKGGIVLVGAPPNVPVNFDERPKRQADDQVRQRYAERDSGGRGGGAGGGGRGGRGGADAEPLQPGHMTTAEASTLITQFLRDNPPALKLTPQGGGRIPGVIVAQNGAGQIYDDTTPQPPAVILRADDFGRIFRIIADGTPVSVEFNISNQFFPEGKTSYVTVGEIPGTDKADEVVMLGGHLDSWTSATGATDNAIGCAIMMEAARILETIGAKPRRTIRVALWSGEEEGLLGSFAYVANHFGSAEQPKPDFAKLDAYWNIDDGTGLVRGASVFGPPAAAKVVAQYVKPFEDLGIYGALPSDQRVEGGSDNGAFAVAGLPGIGANQDPIEYNSTTWHTNLDNYERIVPADVMKNAVISASLVYHLANRDEMLPRFDAKEMPAIPQRGGGGGAGRGRGGVVDTTFRGALHVYAISKGSTLTSAARALAALGGGRGAGGGGAAAPSVATKPAHGTVVLTANGGFVYTPKPDFTGTDSFTYKVSRDANTTAEATITIVVK